MAKISTLYKAELVALTGTTSEEYDADTVKDLIKRIREYHGKDAAKLAKSLIITVNGISIQNKKYYATPLADGDVVGFYPLAAGG